MLGGSWFCTTLPQLKAQIAGWAGVVFCGLCLIGLLTQLFRNGPSVIFDEEGIHIVHSFGMIPWADIVSLRIGKLRSQRFLCVAVNEASIYLSRLPTHKRLVAKANPSLGFPPITVSFSALSPGLDEGWRHLQTTHQEKIAA